MHDLRIPLTLITLNLDMLSMRFRNDKLSGQYSEQYIGYIAQAHSATQRMMTMMDDLLKITTLEANELQSAKAMDDFTQMLDVRAVGYQMQAKKEGKRFSVGYANLPIVKMDADLIGRVLDNLVNNAFKYTAVGGEVRVNARAVDDRLLVYVCDDGPGIAVEHRQLIFEKFAQVKDESGQSLRPGTGLGLTFCRLAVQAHDGKIWVESVLGEGSRFIFTLPLNTNGTNNSQEHPTSPVGLPTTVV